MCLAIPGKIIEIKKSIATIDYGSEKRQAKILSKEFETGDFVIVQNKIVVEKVPSKNIQGWLNLVSETEKSDNYKN